jgi:hypothetical protein
MKRRRLCSRNTLVSSGLENPLQLWLDTFNSLSRGGPGRIAAYTEEATPDNVFKVKGEGGRQEGKQGGRGRYTDVYKPKIFSTKKFRDCSRKASNSPPYPQMLEQAKILSRS